MSLPLISFIVPYYNVPRQQLLACVDSICQACPQEAEREVIVVDDGSRVNLQTELRQIDSQLVYLTQPNSGLSVARNTGMEAAHGQYIQFVDADDQLLSMGYQFVVDRLKSSRADLLQFGFTRSCPSRERACCSTVAASAADTETGAHYLLHHNLRAAAWSYVFRRELLGTLRFTPGTLHEDEEFTPLLLLQAQRMLHLPVTAYYYRKSEQSITTSRHPQHLSRRLDDKERIVLHLYKVAAALSGEQAEALHRRVLQLAMDYLLNVMVLTRNSGEVALRAHRLAARGLYPLPQKPYTKSYRWFARLSATSLGLRFLAWTVPLVLRH